MARKLDEEENRHEDAVTRNHSKLTSQDEHRLCPTPDRALSYVSECGSFEGNEHCFSLPEEPRPQNEGKFLNSETHERKSQLRLGQIEKKMSWSDESGQNLVQYLTEPRSRSPMTSSTQPIKSAMKRSKIVQSNSVDKNDSTTGSNDSHNDQCRYIPSGIKGRAKGGIVVPTGGGLNPTGPGGGTGYISPQWGWYTSLTPPQGEMYASGSSAGKKEDAICANSQIAHLTKPREMYASGSNVKKTKSASTVPTRLVFARGVSAPPREMYASGLSAEKKEDAICVNGQIAHFTNDVKKTEPAPTVPTLPVFTRPVFTRGTSAPCHGWPSVPL